MGHIFSLANNKDKELEQLYRQSISELNDFTGLNWTHSLPQMYVLDGRESINSWQNQKDTSMSGWTYGSHQFYILDKKHYHKEKGDSFKEGDYFKLIKHEMAHCFYQVLTSGITRPIWLWEGFAVYASGQNPHELQDDKFSRFLHSQDTHENGVYQESGYVVDLLIRLKGKQVFLDMLRNESFKLDLDGLFKSIYGLEMNYDSFNEQLVASRKL